MIFNTSLRHFSAEMGITLQMLHAENAQLKKLLESSWQLGETCVSGRWMGEWLCPPAQFGGV